MALRTHGPGSVGVGAPRPSRVTVRACWLLGVGVVLLLLAGSGFAHRPGGGGARAPLPAPGAQAGVPPVISLGVDSRYVRGRAAAHASMSAGTSWPTRVRVPDLRVDRPLVPLSVKGGTLEAPGAYRDVGWWRDGPAPGEKGAAVLVGHVDTRTGPAVFYGLSRLTRGDRVEIERGDGSRAVFVVDRVALYDRDRLPAARVYRAGGRPGLNLLTCGGRFDRAQRRYTGNVVVFTHLARTEARSGGSDR